MRRCSLLYRFDRMRRSSISIQTGLIFAMPTDITTPVHATPIKWTDDEWNKIVVQLYHLKGKGALESDGAAEIKAKDLFEAQNVLPMERRRKQISIAQGFQGIRTRLHELFEKGQQENLFTSVAPGSMGVKHEITTPVAMTAAHFLGKKSRFPQTANPGLFGESRLASYGASDNVQSVQGFHVPKEGLAAGVQPVQVVNVVPTIAEENQRVHVAPQPAAMATTSSVPVHENTCSGRLLESYGSQAAKHQERPKAGLTELARPFVAMVCEELVRAFGQTFSGQEILSALSALLHSDTAGATLRLEKSRSRRENHLERNDATPRPGNDDREAKRPHAAEPQDDGVEQPADVQPLFDPKLPPSASSDFKPIIGLVATRAHEYEDLQMLYPQLRLAIVPAKEIRSPEAFCNCQRIIGLRDEVPQATDDMLKRTLQYRYIHLSGGADSVREQLDAWLTNPGAMQNGPRAPTQRNEKQARNSNANKGGKWPPRVA
jgi:hypothetical protein